MQTRLKLNFLLLLIPLASSFTLATITPSFTSSSPLQQPRLNTPTLRPTMHPTHGIRTVVNKAAITSLQSSPSGGQQLQAPSKPSKATVLFSFYATFGFASILLKSVKRLLPIALEPFHSATPPSPLILASFAATIFVFLYSEGYKAFHLKFNPLLISRSYTLTPSTARLHHLIFAPFYAAGFIGATKKRKIVCYSIAVLVTCLVRVTKYLPPIGRSILDAGVCAGLGFASLSLVVGWIRIFGRGGTEALGWANQRHAGGRLELVAPYTEKR